MDINFEDYLSDDERKEIISDVFRQQCEKKFKEDYERIFSNSAYTIVSRMVDEMHDGNVHELIAKKTLDVIDGLSQYSVFKGKDVWDREESQGHKSLRDAVKASEPVLRQKVEALIAGLDEEVIKNDLRDYACELLEDRLFGGKNAMEG